MDEATIERGDAPRIDRRVVILLVVVLAVAGALLVKGLTRPASVPGTQAASDSITSVHNDAVADYEAALAAGRPIYVLFHSLSCEPCVEISGIADVVVPGYQDSITFVNVITDDASGQELASRFSFQYIPTSFFLNADGTVAESFTGAMDAAQMRRHLDALVAAQ